MRGAPTGASMDERIWTSAGLISLGDLYTQFVSGNLGSYAIYYVDPQSMNDSIEGNVQKPFVGTMNITEVFDQSIHQAITITSEDGLEVTMAPNGFLLDISDWYPTHVVANQASATKHYVAASSGLGGNPGDNLYVRKITGYRMTGSRNIVTLPTPNMITENGFVVIC